MSSNSILKLQVDDKQYEASLKNAQQGLTALQAALRNSGKSFADVDKQTEQYVRELGKMEATAKTTRGRIGEMSSAFVELSRIEKQLTDQERQSPVGKALTESLAQLKQRTIDAKSELQGLENQIKNVGEVKLPDTGGLFSGDKLSGMLQVFGGNLMTKAAGAVANLGSEMYGMVQQGIEMAKAGEGIRIAFERLGRGDILDGLREATHGTVTDLDLMKAAVKFNDFKLPIEELGTMLAFAQQKAKDTGQSVDYMVDSIVTGLGRKSLMILDNLGLSATEIRERMKETGDMTKAVGAIIRDQMAAAGDCVETAADRAAQANVSLQNKMEELGRKFAPLEEASNNFWTSMKIGILDVVGGPLARLLNGLTEAGRMMNAYGKMGGSGKVGQMIANLAGASEGKRQSIYQQQQAQFWKYINPREQQIKDIRAWQSGDRNEALQKRVGAITEKYGSLDATKIQAEVDAAKKMLSEYQQSAKQILQPIKQEITPTITTSGGATGGGGGKGGKTITEEKDDFKEVEEIVGLLNLQKQKLDDLQAMKPFAETEEEIVRLNKEIEKANTEYQRLLNLGKEKPIEIATGTSIQNDAGMSGYIASIKQQLETADYGTSLYNGLSAQLADMTTLQTLVGESLKAGLGTAMFDVADEMGMDFWTRAMEGGVEDIDWQNIIDKINEKLKEMGKDTINIDFGTGKTKDNKKKDKEEKEEKKYLSEGLGQLAGGLSGLQSGFQQFGIDLGDGFSSVVGGLQGISSILMAIQTIVAAIEIISSADAIIPFAHGGIVPHAANGYFVGGTHFSGDVTPIMANAGELVLNKSQQGNLASQLSGSGMQNIKLDAVITGEQIRLVLNNNGRRTGRGEYVQTKSGRV